MRITGASIRAVRGAKEALGALRAGALARTTAATNMNSSSSRSHAVFTLLLRQRRLAADHEGVKEMETDGDAPEQYETLTAKFHFVDLAGSERLKRTGELFIHQLYSYAFETDHFKRHKRPKKYYNLLYD